MRLGVLVPPVGRHAGAPEDWPLGRAALQLSREGIDVVLISSVVNGRLVGHRAQPGAWVSWGPGTVSGVLDRYPSRSRPAEYEALKVALGDTVVVNDPASVTLCADKVATQRVWEGAGLPVPEIEVAPDRFADAVSLWEVAFLKPRFGAFGHGIRRVQRGDATPSFAEGAVLGTTEPTFLQRAVAPLEPWAGACFRLLVQREVQGWVAPVPIVRRSLTDPVVNAARGAEVCLATEMCTDVGPMTALGIRAAEALAQHAGGDAVVELGIDVVCDRDGKPWLLEANGRPQGRLEVLSRQDGVWQQAHMDATTRPLRALARLIR